MTTLLFIVLALIGMPLFIVMGAAALTATHEAQLDPALLIVEFARLAASPNLVAIPLFVLAGATLGQGGAPRRLVRFFNALLGWMPAGIALVATVTCMVFTAFSGALRAEVHHSDVARVCDQRLHQTVLRHGSLFDPFSRRLLYDQQSLPRHSSTLLPDPKGSRGSKPFQHESSLVW